MNAKEMKELAVLSQERLIKEKQEADREREQYDRDLQEEISKYLNTEVRDLIYQKANEGKYSCRIDKSQLFKMSYLDISKQIAYSEFKSQMQSEGFSVETKTVHGGFDQYNHSCEKGVIEISWK